MDMTCATYTRVNAPDTTGEPLSFSIPVTGSNLVKVHFVLSGTLVKPFYLALFIQYRLVGHSHGQHFVINLMNLSFK